MADVQRLSLDEMRVLRERLGRTLVAAEDAFGRNEPLNAPMLDSAVGRQFTGLGDLYKYESPYAVAASLLYGIAMNHPFENGNKRTALVAMLVVLDKNGMILCDTSEDDLYVLVTALVRHEFPIGERVERNADSEVDAVAAWLRQRSRMIERGDRKMTFRELKPLLEAEGCAFDSPQKNFIKIRRGPLSFRMGFPRHDFDVESGTIKKLRRTLQLTEADGTDSAAFYDMGGQVEGFVNRYRALMRRLANA